MNLKTPKVALLASLSFLVIGAAAKKLTPREQAAYLQQALIERIPDHEDYYVDDVVAIFTNITTTLLEIPPLVNSSWQPPRVFFRMYHWEAKDIHLSWEADYSYHRKDHRATGRVYGRTVSGYLFVDAAKNKQGKYHTLQYMFRQQPLTFTLTNFTLSAEEYSHMQYAVWESFWLAYGNESLEGAADAFFAKLNEDPQKKASIATKSTSFHPKDVSHQSA